MSSIKVHVKVRLDMIFFVKNVEANIIKLNIKLKKPRRVYNLTPR